jgi:PKD repeat protein
VDVAVIFPVEALGNEYFAICYEPHVDLRLSYCGPFFNGKNSEFVVVATEDQTQVTITPSKVTDKLKPANIPFTITLDKGELYQVQSMNLTGLPGQGDLTGSFISSDKPVAFYSGSWATTIPSTSLSAWDHLYEQIPPVVSWGRTFVAVPLKSRTRDTYRILASTDQTNVKIAGVPAAVLDRGEFYEFSLGAGEPSLVESNHPVLLAQYSNSNDADKPPGLPLNLWSGDGDPSMLIVSPVDKTRENVTFVAYDTPEITSKIFINIVAKDDAVTSIQLDGNPVAFTSLPNSGYSYAQVQIAPGSHDLNSLEAGKGFIAYVYGFGGVESYGYGVGFNLNITLDLGGELNVSGEKILTNCLGANPLTLDAGSGFTTYEWSTGATTSTILATGEGIYSVKVTTAEGCQLEDSVRVMISTPVVNLGPDRLVCAPETVELDAGSAGQFVSFLWNTPDGNFTSQKIVVTKPGIYAVEAVDVSGCLALDTIRIDYFPAPVIDLGPDLKACYPDVIGLDAGSAGQFSEYLWKTPEGTSTSQKLSVSLPGIYSVEATAASGCKAMDTIKVDYFQKPVLDLTGVKTLVCGEFTTTMEVITDTPGAVITLSSSSPLVTINGLSVSVDPGDSGTYPITVTAINASFCETVETIEVGFFSKLTTGFTLQPGECLGTGENEISYAGTGTILDTYLWDLSGFDDEEIVQNPGETQGPFVFQLKNKPMAVIGLQVISQHNCPGELATITVKRKPVFTWVADPREGCAPLKVDFRAETGDPVDQVDYSWLIGDDLTIQGQAITQEFSSPGQFSVYLQAVSGLTGCSESAGEMNHILVFPNPESGFSFFPAMVYNDQPNVSFLDASKDATRFLWDFGDGTTSGLQNPDHKYGTVGIKKVLQTVYNEYDCSDTTSRYLTVAMSKIFTPNAFSPNASNSVDKEFRLFANGVVADGYHLKIFSRWNDVIFECKNEIKGWDGKLSNGRMAPPGNYVWILEFRDFLGLPHRQSGTVLLFY